jgi:hypothetical protein
MGMGMGIEKRVRLEFSFRGERRMVFLFDWEIRVE